MNQKPSNLVHYTLRFFSGSQAIVGERQGVTEQGYDGSYGAYHQNLQQLKDSLPDYMETMDCVFGDVTVVISWDYNGKDQFAVVRTMRIDPIYSDQFA